jgi:hypothetical protein
MHRKNVRPVAKAAEPTPSIFGIFSKFKNELPDPSSNQSLDNFRLSMLPSPSEAWNRSRIRLGDEQQDGRVVRGGREGLRAPQ